MKYILLQPNLKDYGQYSVIPETVDNGIGLVPYDYNGKSLRTETNNFRLGHEHAVVPARLGAIIPD